MKAHGFSSNAAIERLREAKMRLVSICLDIRELAKQFDHRRQQTMLDEYEHRKKMSAGNYLLADVFVINHNVTTNNALTQ